MATEKVREFPNPLYVKLTTGQSMTWTSQQLVKDLILGSTLEYAVTHLLFATEKKHGVHLVSTALGKKVTNCSILTNILSIVLSMTNV